MTQTCSHPRTGRVFSTALLFFSLPVSSMFLGDVLMKRLFCALAVMLTSVGGSACAGTILVGDVSFEASTGLYTYSYTIDNTAGTLVVDGLNILIDTSTTEGPFVSTASNSGSPALGNWQFGRAQSGSIANPPYNMWGTFWTWGAQNGYVVNPGESLSGFYFSTNFAPTTFEQLLFIRNDDCRIRTCGCAEFWSSEPHPTSRILTPDARRSGWPWVGG